MQFQKTKKNGKTFYFANSKRVTKEKFEFLQFCRVKSCFFSKTKNGVQRDYFFAK